MKRKIQWHLTRDTYDYGTRALGLMFYFDKWNEEGFVIFTAQLDLYFVGFELEVELVP